MTNLFSLIADTNIQLKRIADTLEESNKMVKDLTK